MNGKLFKSRLLATSVFAGFVGAMALAPAHAQEAETDEEVVIIEEEETDGEVAVQQRVTVTGSRLARDEFSSASPLQVIDGVTSRDLGLVDASDLLGQTTVVQGQQITTGVSTSAGINTESGPGSATASLRGLDPGRTLVLVNGRRLAPAGVRGVPSAPDLNMIPGTMIERVDVLLDGASSVYGSDAVAGVVNYILRTDFDGLQLEAYYTDPELSGNGGQQQVYAATYGVSSDRGFMTFAGEYTQSSGFTQDQWGSFYELYDAACTIGPYQGASGQVYYGNCASSAFGAGAISGTPFGFLYYDPGFDAGIAGLPQNFRPIGIAADLITPDSANGQRLLLHPEAQNAVLTPNFRRFNLYSTGEYETDFYGDMVAYYEASHSTRITTTNTSGQGFVYLPDTYALNELGYNASLYYSERYYNQTDVSQTRMIGGVRGDLPFLGETGLGDNWSYDVYAQYSRSAGTDIVEGIAYYPRLVQTFQNTRFDAATGEFVCDPLSIPNFGQTVECRPLDFFDATFINTGRFSDPADNEYLFPNRITNTVVEQMVVSGFVTGDVMELPAGPLGVVLGAEYREDKIRTDTDAGATSGDFYGFSGDPGSNGERALTEGFFEIEIPVLADMTLAEELTFNLAGRYTSETNFGSEFTYRVQGQYAPVEWLRARATVGTSFRAPDLGQQFGGRATGFSNPSDPCRVPGIAVPFGDYDNDPTTPETREYQANLDPRDPDLIARCAAGGGPFNLPAVDPTELGVLGLGTTNPVFAGSPTQVASGSNPNLAPETSQAISAGIVFEQPWFDSFDLRTSVTYYEITVEDEIDQLSAATIAARCYNSVGLSDPQCGNITREAVDPAAGTQGEIVFIEALNQNLGDQVVEGIDYNLEFMTDLPADIGYNLTVRATQSLTQTEEFVTATGIEINDTLGEYGNPEWRLNITNQFERGDWRFTAQSRFLGSMIEDNTDPTDETTSFFNLCVQAGDTPCIQVDWLDDYWVHDASVTWSGETTVVRAGVSNVFDEQPPITFNNGIGSLGGIGYDIYGRTFFVNVSKRF